VLFVYSIGLQVGPGFLASLRRHGLRLNLLAAGVVALGVLLALALGRALQLEPPVLVGLLAGATTNTPSLAAAQQALQQALPEAAARAGAAKLPGLGYAVAYPFGVLGVILAMVAVRLAFRISPRREAEALAASQAAEVKPLARANLEVANPNLDGMPLARVPGLAGTGVVVSRIWQDGTLKVARPDAPLRLGDVLLAVGTREELEALRVVVGRESPLDLRALPGAIASRRLIVTRAAATGRTLGELDCVRRFSVQITRVSRAELEMQATPGFELQYGDTVLAVGESADIQKLAAELGDSPKSLNYTQLLPMFAGLVLGIAVGSVPFSLPGVPAPVRLGLAGGPLLVAIALSRLGRLGPLLWYMPISANYLLRETGIVLFLAAVGLGAGDAFLATLAGGEGLRWLWCGVLVTLVPLLVVAAVARMALGLNYVTLCGLLAGATTDPPALAFASAATGSEAASLAYATVYPTTMILRVLSAQLLVIYLVR